MKDLPPLLQKLTRKEKAELIYLLEEKGKREARSSFWAFCLYFDEKFFLDRPFLKQVADAFQDIYEGKIHSLSVSMPPRAGKSYITSLFAAWFLGNKPEESVMRNTCTARLYNKFSYDTRAILQTDKFKFIFPDCKISEDRANVEGWNLTRSRQVGYYGAGVGGTIIGFGCSGVAITDDLYKSLDDALSETVNESVQRWKESAHDSRLESGCPTIDIGTRWTTNDVIGKNMEDGHYDVSIVIPALDEKGKSFCEKVKTTAEYLAIKRKTAPEIWAGEYMQQPAELEGLLFKKKELKYYRLKDLKSDRKPESILGYIDVADQGTDYFAFPMAKIFKGAVYVTDIYFTRDNIDITLPRTAGIMKDLNPNYVRVETNNQGGSFIRMLRDRIEPSKVLPVTNTQNKHTRALMEVGFIKEYFYFLHPDDIEPGSDYEKFMDQLFKYMKDGSSKHDDAPDSLSGLSLFIRNFLKHLFNDGV